MKQKTVKWETDELELILDRLCEIDLSGISINKDMDLDNAWDLINDVYQWLCLNQYVKEDNQT